MSAAHKIIDGIKDAIAGNFARVTIDGQVWERRDAAAPPRPMPSEEETMRVIDDAFGQIEVPLQTLGRVTRAVLALFGRGLPAKE